MATAKSIAVLPLVNRSPDPENEYFSDGMTEEIINALSQIKGLKVTSRTSSFYFKNKNLPIAEIGQALNVATILEGSIRLANNKMRLTTQLIHVQDDYQFWSKTFERPVEDIFAVQDEISLLIADQLREQLGHFDIEEHLVDAPDLSVDAYQRYLRARYHLLKMHKADIEMGIELLQAIIKDFPHFPYAHLGIHLAYTLAGTIGFMPAMEAFGLGKKYLDQAIAIAPDLPECQLQMAWITFLQDWDLASTYQHIQKGLEKKPLVDLYQTMTSTIVTEGKFKAAHHYIDTAIQMDPFSEINYHLKGFTFYAQEQYGQAIKCFDKSIELKPEFMAASVYKGQALLLSGKVEEALAYFEAFPKEQIEDTSRLGGITLCQAVLGNQGKVEKGLAELATFIGGELTERALYFMIYINAQLKNEEEALKLIQQGLEFRLPLMVYFGIEPLLKPLKANADFQAAIKQILGQESQIEIKDRRYKKTLFSKEELQKYSAQLEQLMHDEQPFFNTQLNLRDLATLMNLPPNYMSQLLNEGFDKNFAEYVNSYRLEAFLEKAADPKQQHLTLLALAYESGFNSKTVFNTFVKKTTGKTPKQLVNSL